MQNINFTGVTYISIFTYIFACHIHLACSLEAVPPNNDESDSEIYSYDLLDVDLNGVVDSQVKQSDLQHQLNLKIDTDLETDYLGMSMADHAAHMGYSHGGHDHGSHDTSEASSHEAHNGHGHGGHAGHSMAMSFNFNYQVDYLFSNLKIKSQTELLLYCVITFCLGLVVEKIRYVRSSKFIDQKSDGYWGE